MPVTKLYVEGELDQQLLYSILGGSPLVEHLHSGGKYALHSTVTHARKVSPDSFYLRDRDFDFLPEAELGTPTEIRTHGGTNLMGWRWCRHSIECYLLQPELLAVALGRGQAELEAHLLEIARALINYQAARWTVGRARATLPPKRDLETHPTELDKDFNLPADLSTEGNWQWLRQETQTFIQPVIAAFGEAALNEQYAMFKGRLTDLDVNSLLVWYSGKDMLTALAPRLGAASPKSLCNQLRDWVIQHPEATLQLLPEWRNLKTVLNQ